MNLLKILDRKAVDVAIGILSYASTAYLAIGPIGMGGGGAIQAETCLIVGIAIQLALAIEVVRCVRSCGNDDDCKSDCIKEWALLAAAVAVLVWWCIVIA